MAASVVQNPAPTTGNGSTYTSPTFSSAPSSDNVVILLVVKRGAAGVAYSAGQTTEAELYDDSPGAATWAAMALYVTNGDGSRTSWSMTGSSSPWVCFAWEVSGLDDSTLSSMLAGTPAEGGADSNATTSGSITTGTLSPEDVFIISALGVRTNSSQGTSVWTNAGNEQAAATSTGGPPTFMSANAGYWTQSSGSTASDDATWSTGQWWEAAVFALKVAAGGTNGTATPSAITRSISLPAPTATGDASTTPSALTLTLTLPTPTATGGATASPAVVPLAATLPAPTATGTTGATATPSAITRTVLLPAPTATGTATASPATLIPTLTLPAPTASGAGDATASPSILVATLLLPAPTTTGSATASPSATSLLAFLPAPTATGTTDGTTTPSSVSPSLLLLSPTVTGTATASPSPLALSIVLPTPDDGTVTLDILHRTPGAFYRIPTPSPRLVLAAIGTGRQRGFKTAEGWERVSSIFIFEAGTHATVDALASAAWVAHSASPAATLLAAIDSALQSAGYRAPGGGNLV